MPIGKLVNKLIGRDSGIDIHVFECSECAETFESAKQPTRASCPECLSNDVSAIRTVDSHP